MMVVIYDSLWSAVLYLSCSSEKHLNAFNPDDLPLGFYVSIYK